MAPSRRIAQSSLAILFLITAIPSSWAFDCKDIIAQKVQFNLGKLAGPQIVHWKEEDPVHDVEYRYNFTIDICKPLQWHKSGSEQTECHHGTQVCAIRETRDLSGLHNTSITPIDIAGNYHLRAGRRLDEKFELFRNGKSNADAGREGFRAELHGGRFPFDDRKTGMNQRAIIEFVCDKDREGTEKQEVDDGEHVPDTDGDDEDDATKEKRGSSSRRDDASSGKGKCEDSDASLRFCGYAPESPRPDVNVQTLRLEWRTKYACENAPAAGGTSSHWGFFTWFLIIFFLATSTYLIFGSWLNYNRYGARGWDLLPHGDTLRDIPYLLKDFGRRVVSTAQGGGSRGGYSAV